MKLVYRPMARRSNHSWSSVYRAFRRISIMFNQQMHEVFVNIYFLQPIECIQLAVNLAYDQLPDDDTSVLKHVGVIRNK
jgi:hypothetical protein